jgi:hypothetical protein
LSSRDLKELEGVLELVGDMKKQGVTEARCGEVVLQADDPTDQGSGSLGI